MEAALAHELGHLARHDPAWLRVLRILEIVFFFQPLNRLARLHFQDASEILADAWAVRHTGSPLHLARSLEKVSSWACAPPVDPFVSTMARRESPVVERVRILLSTSPHQNRWSGHLAALLLVPAVLLPPVRVPGPSAMRIVVIEQVGSGSVPSGTERIWLTQDSASVPPGLGGGVFTEDIRIERRGYRIMEITGS